MSCGIDTWGMLSALGSDAARIAEALFAGALPPAATRALADGRQVPVIAISEELAPLPTGLSAYECRNNRIANSVYAQIAQNVDKVRDQFGADRLGVVVGSSTSGLDATEQAVRHFAAHGDHPDGYSFEKQHAMGGLADFLAQRSGARGPAYTVSTACSSAAKALISARGLIEMGICDAVISGGMDTLCDLTVNGFFALGQVAEQRTNPMSSNREGLNIGEGGALFLLVKGESPLMLSGGGESMDAHHMSAPHPEGVGAERAMAVALADAGISASDVAYVNMHGTATKANDAMESLAIHRLFGDVPCSSTKPFTGHCLGASGAVEAAFSCFALSDKTGRLPVHVWDGERDTTLAPLRLVTERDRMDATGTAHVVSNSFAFGGNNCALVFTRRAP